MTTSRHLGVVALAFAAFTAACGGSDGGTGPSFPDSVSTADAENFAGGVADYAVYVSQAMNFGGPSIGVAAPAIAARIEAATPPMVAALPGVTFRQPDLSLLDWRQTVARARGPQFVAAEGCTVTIRGSYDPYGEQPVDVNDNGIPDDFYVKMECVQTDSVATDTVVTETITQEVAYKELTSSLYGQTIVVRIEQEAHDNHGRYQFIRYNVDGKQDIRSNGVTDQASFTVRQETNISGDVQFVEAGESWDNAFAPATAIALGSDIPDGDLTIGGRRYFADSDGNNLSFGISTTDPLAYSAACALAATNPPFSDGTLLGRLNNSASQASFQVDFTSCGNFTIAVNGAYDEPVVVTARP